MPDDMFFAEKIEIFSKGFELKDHCIIQISESWVVTSSAMVSKNMCYGTANLIEIKNL